MRATKVALAVLCLVATCCLHSDAKRLFGGKSKTSSKTSSSQRPSYHSGSSSSGSGSKPSYSNSDLTRLSYSGTHSQPSRPASQSNLHYSPSHASPARPTAAPIGWKPQGPPPAYSQANPVGGAKTNIHEPPPPYRPSAPPAPISHSSSAYKPSAPAYPHQHTGTSSAGGASGAYRPRHNATGGFGGGLHTPIQATNMNKVHSSYPQQVPAGASYYPAGSHMPAGATYHNSVPPGATYHHSAPPGATYHNSVPAGATYHNSVPAGATYHNAVPPGATYHSSVPAGATYHSAMPHGATYHSPGGMPPGAVYHPAGGVPPGASYYPAASAVPAGATYFPAGAAIPAGATYFAQPPRSSSGPGLGTGLVAGALGGAILGHVLTPTHTRVVEHVGGGGYGGGGGGGMSSGGGDDKIIIINNGPPGSVSTTDVGSGTTIINTGGSAAAVPAATGVVPSPGFAPVNQPNVQPVGEVAAPLAPFGATAIDTRMGDLGGGSPVPGTVVAAPAASPIDVPVANVGAGPAQGINVAPISAGAPGVPAPGVPAPGVPAAVDPSVAGANAPPAPAAEQPAGGIICVPVRIAEPDPADNTKTIEVEKIACYPAPPPEAPQPAADVTTVAPTEAAVVPTNATTVASAAETQKAMELPTSTEAAAPTELIFQTTPEPIISEKSAPLAALMPVPIHVPDDHVALAPLFPSTQPDIMKLPGTTSFTKRSVPDEFVKSDALSSERRSGWLLLAPLAVVATAASLT